MKYYMAYGSNLNKEQMKYRCEDAKVVGTGFVEGYELLFKGSKTGTYATIEPKEGSKVPVGVWKISTDDELMLDRYEGFPTFYYKRLLPVKMENGETLKCLVYIMHEDRIRGIPSDHYAKVCLKGYDDFGLNKLYFLEALLGSRIGGEQV